MKKLTFIILAFMMMIGGNAFAQDVKSQAEGLMKQFFAEQGLTNLEVNIKVIKKMEAPEGLYFIEMMMKDKRSGRTQIQQAFTDGKYLVPDLIDIRTNSSVKDVLAFETIKPVKLDVSGLTLIDGKKSAKHVIVKVSDFQCPYCKKAYNYLHQRIKKENIDVAVYMMHLPLDFHKKAVIYAKVLEAGLMMGKNFSTELYNTTKEFDAKSDAEIKNYFAKKSGNPDKFKKLMKSPSIKGKIEAHKKLAGSLGITGTPHIFFDGKAVGGFKQNMYDMALDSFK
jgi:protein-disulfide isomerase